MFLEDWIDVQTVADLEEAADIRSKRNTRLRVATISKLN